MTTATAHHISDRDTTKSKVGVRTIGYWTCTLLVAFTMISGAYGEYTHQYGTFETHTILGYPTYFLSLIATWKLLGSATILVPGFPRLKEWAYAGMAFNMSGAFVSHLVAHDYGKGGNHLVATGSILLLVLASWALRPQNRALGPWHNA